MDERQQRELRVLQDVIAEGERDHGKLTDEAIDSLAVKYAADLRAASAPDLADRFLAAYDALRSWTTPEDGDAALDTFQRVAAEARLWLDRSGGMPL